MRSKKASPTSCSTALKLARSALLSAPSTVLRWTRRPTYPGGPRQTAARAVSCASLSEAEAAPRHLRLQQGERRPLRRSTGRAWALSGRWLDRADRPAPLAPAHRDRLRLRRFALSTRRRAGGVPLDQGRARPKCRMACSYSAQDRLTDASAVIVDAQAPAPSAACTIACPARWISPTLAGSSAPPPLRQHGARLAPLVLQALT